MDGSNEELDLLTNEELKKRAVRRCREPDCDVGVYGQALRCKFHAEERRPLIRRIRLIKKSQVNLAKFRQSKLVRDLEGRRE